MRAYIKDLQNLSYGVRRFILSEILLGIGIGLFMLVLNLHLLDLGVNEEQIGRISSVGALFMGILGIPSGLLANYMGRKRMLVSGIAIMSLSYLIFGLGTKLWIFYAAQMIQSLGITLLVTSEIQLLFRYCQSKKEETQSFSLLFAIFTLFTGFGTLIGGILPRWLGGHTSIYQSSLIVAAAILFASALLRAVWLPKESTFLTPEITKDTSKDHPDKKPHKEVSIWILSIFILLSGFTFGWIGNFLNIIVKFRMQWSDEWVSLALTLNGLFLFAGSLFMPYLLARWGISKSFIRVYAINILSAFLLCLALPNSIFISILFLRSGLFTLLNNMTESQSMSAVSEHKRNLFAGMRSVFRSIGLAGSTYLTGVILTHKNYALPFLWASLAILMTLAFFWIWVRPLLEEKLAEKQE
ncbi:MFS transporter [Paenibacillus sp. GP183]|jgi:DHA1 family multidrug resistance protein-like MFS transporter|uniref:MFS transporter n=1 Tax=Paenibacillus sp. GP183 TaxID=1882751 RepID=UPI000896D2B5|nr:MFS transporter [Paenibacillus sp. GP183]SEB54433.1 Predicted arabinose efflux permease, MFS family [Paenibacillus sp. GP183]